MKRALAAILFLTGLATLIGLGTWQYQRLQWKNEIIANLDAQYAALESGAAPLTNEAMASAAYRQERPFLVGALSGRLQSDKIFYVGPRSINGTSGYDAVVPVSIADGVVLAQIGWMEESRRGHLSFPQGVMTMNGVARKPDYSRFAGGNSPANDLWFHTDIEQMAMARDITGIAPLVFYADELSPAIDGLQLRDTRWYPRNKHRDYMLFWFGMALAWIAVFALAYRRHQRQG